MSFTLGLVSPMAAGKGTVARYLVKRYHAKEYRFSKPINDVLERLYIPPSRENQIKLASAIREQFGDDVWAKIIKNDVLKDNPEIAVIDGIRVPADLRAVKTLPHFILVAIDARADTRFSRLQSRRDRPGDDTIDRETFDALHNKITEKYILTLMEKADVTVTNNGSIEELYKKIDSLIKQAQ